MINTKSEIADTFYAFHDGGIVFEKAEDSYQIWKIDCQYLAEMINPNFNLFWMKIYDCDFIQFNPWMNPIQLPKEIWTETRDIFKAELEISTAKVKDEKIEISCNQQDSNFDFCGGELLFDCKGVEVFDQEWNKIEPKQLGEICTNYWNK